MGDGVKAYKPTLRDYFREDLWLIVCLVALFLLGLFVLFCVQGVAGFDWASLIFGFVPVVPMGLVWFLLRKRRWVDALPIYLKVTLKSDQDRLLAVVHYVPMQTGMDVRQIAQSVLRKVNNGQNLVGLEPFIRPENYREDLVRIDCSDRDSKLNSGKPFELREVGLVTEMDKESALLREIPDGESFCWTPLFGADKPERVSSDLRCG